MTLTSLARAFETACGAAWLSSLAPANQPPDPAPQRPNILIIRTDDQDVRSMETALPNGQLVMRNVRELIAEQGVRFPRSFASFPLCCPSRATSITGQYAHNHGVQSNQLPNGSYAIFDESNTLPMWMQRAGYYTGHIGKYLNGWEATGPGGFNTPIPPGWNRWFTLLTPSSNFQYFSYPVNDDGAYVTYGNAPSDYQTDVLTRKTREFLVQRPYGARPFFLMLDYGAPHAGPLLAVPAPRHLGLMNGAPLPMPPSFNEIDVSDKPAEIAALPPLDAAAIDGVRVRYWRRTEALLAVDEGVAALVDTLRATRQLENTVIVFTSDNGFQSGEHRIPLAKGYPYEAAQVPLYVRGPGIPSNAVRSQLVSNVDLAPTILDLAGAAPGLPQDGRSLLPLIAQPWIAWRGEVLLENPFEHHYRGLRTLDASSGREHLYLEYDYDFDGVTDECELYNVTADECSPQSDVFLLESRHDEACWAALASQLRQRLQALRDCAGGDCP